MRIKFTSAYEHYKKGTATQEEKNFLRFATSDVPVYSLSGKMAFEHDWGLENSIVQPNT